MEDGIRSLTEKVTVLEKSNETLQKEKHRSQMESELRRFKDMGVFPSTLEIIKPILLSDAAKNFSITLSEVQEEGKDPIDRTYGFVEVLNKIFESIPEDHRISTKEKTRVGEKTTLSVEDVQKYADEHKIEYADALIALSKEGRISEE